MTSQELEQRLLELLSLAGFDTDRGDEMTLQFSNTDDAQRFRMTLIEYQCRTADPVHIDEFNAARKAWREANTRVQEARKRLPASVAAKIIAESGKSTFPSHTFNSPALALQRDNTERLEQARQRDALPDREPDDT